MEKLHRPGTIGYWLPRDGVVPTKVEIINCDHVDVYVVKLLEKVGFINEPPNNDRPFFIFASSFYLTHEEIAMEALKQL